jgi:hypothetical protein
MFCPKGLLREKHEKMMLSIDRSQHISRLLKKASCLCQNAKSKKCDFYFSHKIKGLALLDFAETSLFRSQAVENREYQQPARAWLQSGSCKA